MFACEVIANYSSWRQTSLNRSVNGLLTLSPRYVMVTCLYTWGSVGGRGGGCGVGRKKRNTPGRGREGSQCFVFSQPIGAFDFPFELIFSVARKSLRPVRIVSGSRHIQMYSALRNKI